MIIETTNNRIYRAYVHIPFEAEHSANVFTFEHGLDNIKNCTIDSIRFEPINFGIEYEDAYDGTMLTNKFILCFFKNQKNKCCLYFTEPSYIQIPEMENIIKVLGDDLLSCINDDVISQLKSEALEELKDCVIKNIAPKLEELQELKQYIKNMS